MICWKTLKRVSSLAAVWSVAALVVADPAMSAAPRATGQEGNAAVTIRHHFAPGRLLRYHMQLAGDTAWNPPLRPADRVQMATEFTFTLRGKTVRPGGACTFDLLGEGLRSTGQTPAGRINVAAGRGQSAVSLGGRETIGFSSAKSPLDGPMTITLGPRGEYRFGTGLLPLVIYMLPNVDHRFWTLLTAAPLQPVAPGDRWEVAFAVPVPGSEGRPLQIAGEWRVLDRERHGRRDVLPIQLTATLDLDNANVLLQNGDEIHVSTGSYTATGRALWDVEAGLLCSATAEQSILIAADMPVRRTLRSENRCALRLLGMQEP